MRKGYILQEIVIAVAIFCIFMVPVIGLLYRCREYNNFSRQMSSLSFNVQGIMEYMETVDTGKLTGLIETCGNPEAFYYISDDGDFINIDNYAVHTGINCGETYEDVLEKLPGLSQSSGYINIIRIILSKDSASSAFLISVSAWKNKLGEKSKIDIVSIRSY